MDTKTQDFLREHVQVIAVPMPAKKDQQDRWTDEAPNGAAWKFREGEQSALGTYINYGPDHYRSSHEYCTESRPCRDCQPGNVLAVVYHVPPPHNQSHARSHYFPTTSEARRWIDQNHR